MKLSTVFEIIFLYKLIFLVQPCTSQQCDPSVELLYNISLYSSYAVNRTFSLSGDAPVARHLLSNSHLHKPFNQLISLFQDINQVFDNRNKTHDPRTCNLYLEVTPWVNITAQTAHVKQIGEINTKCNSQFLTHQSILDDTSQFKFHQRARSTIINGRAALFKALSSINIIPDKNRPDLEWATGLFELKNWNLRRENQQCKLDRASAYNYKGKIYVIAEMTNHPIESVIQDPNRQVIAEFVKEDMTGSLEMIQHAYNTTEINIPPKERNGCLQRSTTMLGTWSGKVSLTAVGLMSFSDHLGLQTALLGNEVEVDIASDSITPSNTAILILPIVMSLIPVAFIAELDTWATFWYIVFTDIFAIIPFIIKGIELIVSSRKSPDIVQVFRSGDREMGQIEIWVASCQGVEGFRVIGIAFVVLAPLLMIIGISLETWAKNYMRRKRFTEGAKAEGPFGIPLFRKAAVAIKDEREVQLYELNYDEEKNRRYSQEEALYKRVEDEEEYGKNPKDLSRWN